MCGDGEMKKIKELNEYNKEEKELPTFKEVNDGSDHIEFVSYKDALDIALKVLKNLE